MKTVFAFLICLTLITGCIPSLHPLYTEKDVVKLPALEGSWDDDDGSTWLFEPAPGQQHYQLTIRNADSTEEDEHFVAHAVKLGSRLFFDFFPVEPESDLFSESFYGMHFIPAHSFAVLEMLSDSMLIRLPEPEYLHKLFREGKVRLKHEIPEDQGIIVLTASTTDLQKFVAKYAEDQALFSTEIQLAKVAAR